MSIFAISRTIRHFYFNYHHSESTPIWIHSAFIQRIQFSFRQVICFLFVGFLAYGTQLANQLSLEYLVPIISILCLQQTFGSTLSCCYQITLAITPLSIFLFVIKKIGLGYHNYLATELLLLFTSFCVAYGCTQVQTRKFSLLYNVIYFAGNFSNPSILSTYSFELLGVYLLGMVMALLVSLIIFPLFATFDIENRFNYSLSKLQRIYTLTIQAFLCPDKMSAYMSLTRASLIENMVHNALTPIPMKLDKAHFEPARLLQKIFNRKHRHIIDLTLQNDFTSQTINLQEAFKLLRTAYITTSRHQVKHALEIETTIQSEDHLSHAFFLFQLDAIVQLLTQIMTNDNRKKDISKISKKNTINLKEQLKLQWPRLLSSLKSMVIIGVGSIFVLVPRLAAAFENGQWILVTLCMA
ncbi:unnamed protein product [Rotaria sordida]|uniref:Uncharacterized protein n=1 Tax=Rotaria sordida TaxID=392033 RepID=A0A815RDM5_9BILA|nr:unnamed protein product [Rotaria sordida]CAF1646446.1 unnamed protein product [Rotaria sordida]